MTFFSKLLPSRLICAHRGFRSHLPENTLSAFKASIGRCHFIELDIQMSKDAVPMVTHDPTLARTSDASSKRNEFGLESLDVENWDAVQLKTLDMGSWFIEADPFHTIKKHKISIEHLKAELPQTILTLEELLLHPALNAIPLNIEIKNHTGQRHDKVVAEAAINIIKKTHSEKRVLISSFKHEYLLECKRLAPNIPTGALQRDFHPQNLIEYLHSLGVAAYHPREDITDSALIEQLRAAGFRVNVFTVNDKRRQEELFQQGATSIITDFPVLEDPPPQHPAGIKRPKWM